LTLYCNSSWQTALQKQQLATFDQIWDFPIQWIDTPNQNRGGWSGVGCVEMVFEGEPVTLFVKKQLNHTTRTLRHPIQGEPTFATEFHTIRFLQAHGITTPNVVFFGQRSVQEGQQAILVTEMLAGYQPLDKVQKSQLSLLQQRTLLRCVAQTIGKLHQLGVQHRALYAKHIFVKPREQSFDVALIDLEKSRRMLLPWVQAMTDLVTLNYRTKGWNRSARYCFYKHYLGRRQLSVWNIMSCRYIKAKSARKS
jgi:tRNA A-37 threonylcarbamoyl transferase component Bud32